MPTQQPPNTGCIPPVLRVELDPRNEFSGCRILWFKESPMGQPLELHVLSLRGRETLPDEKFFASHDVYAVETASSWQEPIHGKRNVFARRVLCRPIDSKLITPWNSFRPGDPNVHYLYGRNGEFSV